MTSEEMIAFLIGNQFELLPGDIRALSYRDPNRTGNSRETIHPGLVIGNKIVQGIFKLGEQDYVAVVENNRGQPEWQRFGHTYEPEETA